MAAALHCRDQLVVEALVGEENRSLGGKQQILHDVDFVAELEQTEAGLQNADIDVLSHATRSRNSHSV